MSENKFLNLSGLITLVNKLKNYFSSKDHSHIVADTKEPQSQNVNDIWLKEL